MGAVTFSYHKAKCPKWPTDVTISVKYRIIEHQDPTKSTGKARYVGAVCGIRENLRKPEKERDPKLSVYAFCGLDDCPLLQGSSYPEIVDT